MIDKLRYLISYLIDVKIYSSKSELNSNLTVILRNGKKILNAKNANYSFGDLHKVFQIVFKKIDLKAKVLNEVLILGYGAGSVSSIIRDELKLTPEIVGIEADLEVIEISKKYFHKLNNKDVLIHDKAENYISYCTKKFDLIVIDVFVDLSVPIAIQSFDYLKKISVVLSENGTILYNFVQFSKESKEQFIEIEKKCNSIFRNVETLKVIDFNRVLVLKS